MAINVMQKNYPELDFIQNFALNQQETKQDLNCLL